MNSKMIKKLIYSKACHKCENSSVFLKILDYNFVKEMMLRNRKHDKIILFVKH